MEELLNDGDGSDEGSYGRWQWMLQTVTSWAEEASDVFAVAEEATVLSLDDGRSCT